MQIQRDIFCKIISAFDDDDGDDDDGDDDDDDDRGARAAKGRPRAQVNQFFTRVFAKNREPTRWISYFRVENNIIIYNGVT